MATRVRTYYAVPSPVVGYPLSGARISVIVPTLVDVVNRIANPSLEKDTTGYTLNNGASIARVVTKQQRGAYALEVTPASGSTSGVYYGTVSTVAGQTYTWSFDFWGRAGLNYRAVITDTTPIAIPLVYTFTGKGFWERRQVLFNETVTGLRRLYIYKSANTDNLIPFYIDGMMVVSYPYPFKYFDGDSLGTTPARTDFFWNGTPHGSTSTMIAQSRTAGRIVDLSLYGFVLLALMGANGTPVNNVGVPLALVGGEQYQRTVKQARIFDLVGTIAQSSPVLLKSYLKSLRVAFDADVVSDQLMHLQYQSMNDCGEAVGNIIDIPCKYVGGLEGNRDNPYQEQLDIKFKAYLPIAGVLDGSEGAALDVRDALADADYILRRDREGIWSDLQTGLNGDVRAVLWLLDGRLLVAGAFTDAGGVANADYLAIYDPATDTFSALNATPLNATVYTLLQLPDGNVAFGGLFTNAGGAANADYLAKLTISTGAYSTFNATPLTGGSTSVNALAQLPDGNVAVAGIFLNAGGDANADYLAKMDGITGAFSAFNATPLNGAVNALEVSGNYLYGGGSFTNGGGLADADYIVRMLITTGGFEDLKMPPLNNTVSVIRRLSSGALVIGGLFTDVMGDTSWDFLALYTGGYEKVVSDLRHTGGASAVASAAELTPGTYMVGGNFDTANGILILGGLLQISGNTLVPLDVQLPGLTVVYAIGYNTARGVVLGTNTSGIGYTSGTSTLTNSGTAKAYPVIVISHPTTATVTAPLRSIRNLTTRDVISFNLTLLIGETVTIDTSRKTVTSNIRGNLYGTILPGSNFATFHLASGANRINIFSTVTAGDVPTAYAYWTPAYDAVEDAEY